MSAMGSEMWIWTALGACGLAIWLCVGWLAARAMGEFLGVYDEDDDPILVVSKDEARHG